MGDDFKEILDTLGQGDNPTKPINGDVIIPSVRSSNAGTVETDFGLHAFIENKISGTGHGMDDN